MRLAQRLPASSFALWVLMLQILVRSLLVAGISLPTFDELKLFYPGDVLHGGRFTNADVLDMIGGEGLDDQLRPNTAVARKRMHEFTSLRLSWTLNKVAGPHTIGVRPVRLSKHKTDSYTGSDGLQYIYRAVSFGPFLAQKYGNPKVLYRGRTVGDSSDHESTLAKVFGRQGIVRLVTYNNKLHVASGRLALWDCDHFHEAAEWIVDRHLVAAEFWQTPDSHCPNATRQINGDENRVSSDLALQIHKLFINAQAALATSTASASSTLPTPTNHRLSTILRLAATQPITDRRTTQPANRLPPSSSAHKTATLLDDRLLDAEISHLEDDIDRRMESLIGQHLIRRAHRRRGRDWQQ